MSNKKCPICGKDTYLVYGKNPRKDGLCYDCSQKLFKGEIVQCPDCKKWKKTNENCECDKSKEQTEKQENKYETCVICGEKSNGKPQCKNCHNETKGFMDTLDKNGNVRKFRDYYYNLKERIFIIRGIEETKKQCNKLVAIAMMNQNVNDDTSLMERVYKDVETLIKAKKPIEIKNEEVKEQQKEEDQQKVRINIAADGHTVESQMEVIIDNLLYHNKILHCYGKSISEITEKRKKCDWFIPITGTGMGDGIYIEYWGMETEGYKETREEKEELYKKHNIPYISIEKSDPQKDSQTFEDNLLRDLKRKAINHFGFMPSWTKQKE